MLNTVVTLPSCDNCYFEKTLQQINYTVLYFQFINKHCWFVVIATCLGSAAGCASLCVTCGATCCIVCVTCGAACCLVSVTCGATCCIVFVTCGATCCLVYVTCGATLCIVNVTPGATCCIMTLLPEVHRPKQIMRRGVLMNMLQQNAISLPLWIGKPGER